MADSGICLLSHSPLTSCPNFISVTALDEGETDGATTVEVESANDPGIGAAAIPVKPAPRVFHTGLALGSDDALAISRSSYCHLVGILGASEAGKTCYILSLYLKALRGELPAGYRFSRSLTLKGFEERARLYRDWEGGRLPERLAERTILSDARQAALLHLGLRQGPLGRRVDLLLTDIPGEWSTTLVTSASGAPRFEFLRRADGILLVVDGEALMTSRRNIEVNRTRHLVERLKNNVGVDASVPLTILISKGDRVGMRRPPVTDDLIAHADKLGYSANAVVTAAFSYDTTVQSGTGVFEALEPALSASNHLPPAGVITGGGGLRQISAFRRRS